MKTGLALFALLALVAGVLGAAVVEPASSAWRDRETLDDPAARASDAAEAVLTPQRLHDELETAIVAEDDELAQSFLDLAGEKGLKADPNDIVKLDALKADSWRPWRDFAGGFVFGGKESAAGLAGTVAGDAVGYGDLRDLAVEGGKAVAGSDADKTVVALALAGLAASVATYTTLGTAAPVRGGLSVVKSAAKAGRLSKPLAGVLGKLAVEAVDGVAVRGAIGAAVHLDLDGARAAARAALRPQTLAKFEALAADASTILKAGGQRGARQVLAVAESPEEIARAAKIAQKSGSKLRATLKLLGRGALLAVALSFAAAQWIMAFLGWLLGLAMFARKFGTWLGRRREQPAAHARDAWAELGFARPGNAT